MLIFQGRQDYPEKCHVCRANIEPWYTLTLIASCLRGNELQITPMCALYLPTSGINRRRKKVQSEGIINQTWCIQPARYIFLGANWKILPVSNYDENRRGRGPGLFPYRWTVYAIEMTCWNLCACGCICSSKIGAHWKSNLEARIIILSNQYLINN